MKCINCGAEIGLDVEKCPYCSTVNKIAKKRKQNLVELEADNEKYRKNVLKNSKELMRYRIHKLINVVLAFALIMVLILSNVRMNISEQNEFAIEQSLEMTSGEDSSIQLIEEYYNAGEYENLYCYLAENDLFGADGMSKYGQMSLFWFRYQQVQICFMRGYNDYIKNGAYSRWNLEKCVKDGYYVLTGTIPNVSGDLESENAQKAVPLQEDVYMLFTGALKIPEEMLIDLEKNDEEKQNVLIEYVLEVLPNEE